MRDACQAPETIAREQAEEHREKDPRASSEERAGQRGQGRAERTEPVLPDHGVDNGQEADKTTRSYTYCSPDYWTMLPLELPTRLLDR